MVVAKRGRGRPAGPVSGVRRNRIATTVTDAELAEAKRRARKAGVPVATWVHGLIEKALRRRS